MEIHYLIVTSSLLHVVSCDEEDRPVLGLFLDMFTCFVFGSLLVCLLISCVSVFVTNLPQLDVFFFKILLLNCRIYRQWIESFILENCR